MKYRSQKLRNRGLTEALMKATGLIEQELENPLILVMNSWNELHPGHMYLRQLSEAVKAGVRIAGGTPFESNTIALCDGIRTPESNKYILPSREIIADSIEVTAEAFQVDGMVLISACDKIEPACLMAAARVNVPTLIVSGGAMNAGTLKGKKITNQDMNDAGSGYRDGEKMTQEQMKELTDALCGSGGGCWGMGTANTMACLIEAIGMSIPNCACSHATDSSKIRLAKLSGVSIVDLVKRDIKPSDIMTEDAFENCLTVNEAIGGSTNTFIHLPAIASELGIDLKMEKFDEIGAKTPQLCGVMPAGPYYMSDLRDAGGIPAVMKNLRDKLNLNCMTVSGKTLGDNIKDAEVYNTEVIRTLENPFKKAGSHAVLKGNLATEGAVIKMAAVPANMMSHRGPARVYETCEDAMEAIRDGKVNEGDVVVIRYEGPKGGPGMREMIDITRTLSSINCEDKIALVTDGRFSGYSSGAVIGHVSPEAQEGGVIAIVQNGDMISYDIDKRELTLEVSEAEIERRMETWNPKEIKYKGYMKRYSKEVSSGAAGAIIR